VYVIVTVHVYVYFVNVLQYICIYVALYKLSLIIIFIIITSIASDFSWSLWNSRRELAIKQLEMELEHERSLAETMVSDMVSAWLASSISWLLNVNIVKIECCSGWQQSVLQWAVIFFTGSTCLTMGCHLSLYCLIILCHWSQLGVPVWSQYSSTTLLDLCEKLWIDRASIVSRWSGYPN